MRSKTIVETPSVRLSLVLGLAGLAGVLSTLRMDLPIPEGTTLPMPLWAAKLLSLIQPTVLLLLAVWAGVRLAPRVNLRAPAFEALSRGDAVWPALQPQLVPGLLGGLVSGLGLVLVGTFTPAALADVQDLFDPPLTMRLLYGGITEELLLRWGLLTFVLWGSWRLLGTSDSPPGAALAWGAIVISALLFGVGHLPVVFTLVETVPVDLVVYIVGANGAFGLLFGYLFWQYGLEAAMLAHALTHLVAELVSLTSLLP